MYFVDSTGRLVESDPADVHDYDALIAQGLKPAVDEDIARHNHSLDVAEADAKAYPGQAFVEEAGRTLLAPGTALAEAAFGPMSDAMKETPVFGDESIYGKQARLRREASPGQAMAGQMVGALPFAIPLGAGAGALAGAAGAGTVGTAVAAAGAEAVSDAVIQEHEDAWFEERPFELKNVAANAALFAAGDLTLRGVVGLGGKLLKRRNVIAEASSKAQKYAPDGSRPRPASVGAAARSDYEEEVATAINKLSDRDAAVLARDKDEYVKLAAVSATDQMNRIQRGLNNELSYQTKIEDWQQGSKLWTSRNRNAQDNWLRETVFKQAAEGDVAIEAGGQFGYDFGGMGKGAREIIDRYGKRLQGLTGDDLTTRQLAERNQVLDGYKRALDGYVQKVGASRTLDEATATKLNNEILIPMADSLRKGLENPKLFGKNARLQKEVNPGWKLFLQHWKVIDAKLYESTGERLYGVVGARSRVKEATTRRLYNAMVEDPALNREFLEHLKGGLEGLEQMMGARQRWGASRLPELETLQASMNELARDWNFASLVSAADARVRHLKARPASWAGVAAKVALQRAPFGIGQAASALGDLLEHTELQKGTALANVVDEALGRYAKHPILQDPTVAAHFPPWMRAALAERTGVDLPPTPRGGMTGGGGPPEEPPTGVAGGGSEFFGKVAGPAAGAGLFGVAASQDGEDGDAAMMAGAGLLLPLLFMKGKGRRSLVEALRIGQEHAHAPGKWWSAPSHSGRRFLPFDEWKALGFEGKEAQRLMSEILPAAPDLRGLPDADAEKALKTWLDETPHVQKTLQLAKREGATAQAAITRAAKKGSSSPEMAAARESIGKSAERLQTEPDKYGDYGYTTKRAREWLKSKAPLSAHEAGAFASLFGVDSPILARARAASQGLPRHEQVAVQDRMLRDTLRDALGMRKPAPRELSPSVDAAARYAKGKPEFNRWKQSALTDDELEAVHVWQTHAYRAIAPYVRGGGPELEAGLAFLKEHRPDIYEAVRDRLPAISANIQTSLNKAIEAGHAIPGAVRRGIALTRAEADQLKVAKEAVAQGFMSTSTHKSTPKGFANRRAKDIAKTGEEAVPVMFHIEQKTGVPLGTGEGELTLRPGTRFAIDSADEYDGMLHVSMRETAPSTITPEELLNNTHARKLFTSAIVGGGLLGIGFGGEAYAAELAVDDIDAARAANPGLAQATPASPSLAYARALKNIQQGGRALLDERAKQLLTRVPPKSRGPLSTFMRGQQTLSQAFESRRARLDELSDPEALITELGESFGELPQTHPTVFGEMVARSMRVVEYLRSELPARTGKSLLDPKGAEPGYDAQIDFALKYAGATDPDGTLRDIARGRAFPQQVEATKALHPEVFDQFRASVLGELVRMGEQGKSIPVERQRQIDDLLDLDGAAQPAFGWAMSDRIEQARAAEPQPPKNAADQGGGGGQSPALASRLQTRQAAGAALRQQA